ncbi:WcaA Glycosyltransferases involved in cell wall biogenesis [Burkholderiales bacterium]
MKVSVITVCLNCEGSIERTLKSVEEQLKVDIEHILIDGTSTDQTLKIVSMYQRTQLVLRSEPDEGIYDAMNKGLAISTGDIICFLNADDHYVSASTIYFVVDQIKKFDLDILLADVHYFQPGSICKPLRRYRSKNFNPSRLAWGWMPAHPAMFVRKTVYDRVGKFDKSFKISGDYDWIVRAFTNQNLRYQHLSQVLVNMQTGGVSTRGLASTLLLNKEVIRACRQNGLYTNWLMILSKYPKKFIEYFIK